MALIEPNSTIVLFKDIPFDPSYRDTMYFASTTAQESWFSSFPTAKKKTYTAVSYQRRSRNVIRLEELHSWAYNVNYMAFKNTSFENNWFYAFVENVEYINNITVEITYKLDVIQSWLFAYGNTNMTNFFSECTIERCHTPTDIAGEHTLPESMPLGEYIYNGSNTATYTSPVCVVVASSIDYTDPDNFAPGRVVKGGDSLSNKSDYYSGLYLLEVPLSAAQGQPDPIEALNDWLETINEDGLTNSIVSISMADSNFIAGSSSSVSPVLLMINRPATLGSYTPKNNKLLTYPYTCAAVRDNTGHENEYQFELFTEYDSQSEYYGYVVFKVWGNNNPSCSLMLWPAYYKQQSDNYSEQMESARFPACAWNSDTYKAMLAQMLSTAPVQIAAAAASGALTGGASGAAMGAASAALGVATNLAMLDANPSNKIPTVHGSSNSDLTYQRHGIQFTAAQKMIRPEYAAIIDKFFDMYGYRVEKTGIPNINARPKYTYVKTRNSSIGSLIPAADAREIEGIFDTGIRFWTTSAVFGSYDWTQNNNAPITQSNSTPSEPVPSTPDPEEESES